MTEVAQPRALVVDDEPQMVDIVTFALETQGFTCRTARSAEEAWRRIGEERFDLVVLDVMLPGASGVQLCRRIRAQHHLPVLLLTARGEVDDRVAGLEAGADDYVTKPFSPRELALRAQGIVRRSAPRPTGNELIVNGPLTVDVTARDVSVGVHRVALTDVEFRVLVALARRAGEVVGWRELLNEVWSTSAPHGGRQMIKTAVYRLRGHLQAAAGEEAVGLVVAERGVGYSMPRIGDGRSVTQT